MPRHPRGVPKRCVRLVARFEGFFPEPYNDPAGHATIGYGKLLHYGPVTDADRAQWGSITEAHARRLLKADLAGYAAAVRSLVKVPLNQRQFSALISFAYNCGIGALEQSTLLKRLNKGEYAAVPSELLKWDKATINGELVPLRGLTRRRLAEGHMFRPRHKPNRYWR
jgi:GH24 family phage-related lysozyme (muramidase)